MFDGNILKKLRLDKGLNQQELAEALSSTQKNISNYENNRARPDFEVLINMSEYFNVSVDYLLGLTNITLDSLSENELFIINTFRSLEESTKFDFLSMVKMVFTLRDMQRKNFPNGVPDRSK